MELDQIEKNWETYEKLCNILDDEHLKSFLNQHGERIAMCPASTRTDQYGCEPGGLVKHALDVALKTRSLNESMDLRLDLNSVLKVSLLHEVGKIGDLENDYFIPQESEWHREKLGQMFIYNPSIQKMSVSHRTLFLLQHFGINLSTDEWIAIQVSAGLHFEENRFYSGSEPTLALALCQSKQLVIHQSINSNNG
tara:strand:+ start:77 stop:661 length:585 start_codon:yes stop_codon:yes gene_type:complete